MLLYTLDQLKEMRRVALEELIQFAGGRTHLSRMLSVPLATVNSWVDRGLISKGGADKVQENSTLAKEFPVSRLRPDL